MSEKMNQTGQHTPGPWRVDDDRDGPAHQLGHVIDKDRNTIAIPCAVGHIADPEGMILQADINARLIAAAPEMYDALHVAAGFIAAVADVNSECFKMVKAAIDKADGK